MSKVSFAISLTTLHLLFNRLELVEERALNLTGQKLANECMEILKVTFQLIILNSSIKILLLNAFRQTLLNYDVCMNSLNRMYFRSTSLRGLQTSGKPLSSLIVMEMGKFQEKNLEWYVFFGPVFNIISFRSSLLVHG